jgi:predicted nucleic-acid-binding Zn-ribbon protein
MPATRKGCPRCSSTDTYRKLIQTTDRGVNLLFGIKSWPFSVMTLWIHVCARCGHVEFSLPKEYLAQVKEKFEGAPF